MKKEKKERDRYDKREFNSFLRFFKLKTVTSRREKKSL
jgi:hypothetical protein